MDFPNCEPQQLLDYCRVHGLKELLVVTGDVPDNKNHSTYDTTAIDLIKQIKLADPSFTVYAAIDPYRSDLPEEMAYTKQKLNAGVDGFFTQPFFDLDLLDVYADALIGQTVFWGVSPVLTEQSQKYWSSRNKVHFPDDFEPTLDWNCHFAKRVLARVKERQDNIYFMPIRVDLDMYLSGIFDS
jgi:methylenetetrahydrofolate reductase (NADPH)